MNLHLVDFNADLVAAWKDAFRPFPEVSVQQGDLLEIATNCVVSPANSYGFMDGGIDAVYCGFFGRSIERTVREAIARRPEGHLPVGASLVVRTSHKRVPYLIVAPTMSMPEAVPSENCYRAMKAVLRIAGSEPDVGREVYCPGMGTGVGMVTPANGCDDGSSLRGVEKCALTRANPCMER